MDRLYFGTTRLFYERRSLPDRSIDLNNVWASIFPQVARERAVYQANRYEDQPVVLALMKNRNALFESAGEDHYRVTGIFQENQYVFDSLIKEKSIAGEKTIDDLFVDPENVPLKHLMPFDSEDFFREIRLRKRYFKKT